MTETYPVPSVIHSFTSTSTPALLWVGLSAPWALSCAALVSSESCQLGASNSCILFCHNDGRGEDLWIPNFSGQRQVSGLEEKPLLAADSSRQPGQTQSEKEPCRLGKDLFRAVCTPSVMQQPLYNLRVSFCFPSGTHSGSWDSKDGLMFIDFSLHEQAVSSTLGSFIEHKPAGVPWSLEQRPRVMTSWCLMSAALSPRSPQIL